MEVAEIGAEAAKQQVTIEDCPDVGDTEVVATIIVASKPPAAAAPAAVEVEEEEIVERDGEITIVVEKVKIVQQENVTNAADGDVGDGAEVARTTTTTTTCTTTTEGDGGDSTTPITSTSGVNTIEPPKTNESDEQDEPTKNTNKTTKKITVTSSSTTTTATPGTPIQQEMKAVEVAKVKKQDEGGTKVEEVEEEDVEEDDEDDDEEEEEVVVEDVKDGDSGVPVTESHPAPSSNTPQQVPVAALAAPQPQQHEKQQQQEKQEIISDIDRDIEQQEDVAKLKAQQEELLKQQQLLAQQIRQQQLLAQQLAAQNKLQEQQLQQQQLKQQLQEQQLQQQPQGHVPKSTTFEESKNENGYTSKNESYEIEETSNVKKRIDLQKIFTPATDAEEILPKNRKLYASSAFYSPTLHPTVEDQVELARRISHSLSDISNQQSKGQSMYVNRKKRSVKWVHEGSGKDSASHGYEYEEESKENTEYNHDASEYNTGITTTSSSGTKTDGQMAPLAKVPLKLVMNPRGQIRDFNTEREALNTETGLMSPDKCAELVTALNTQKGKGAELFAKRRRKAEKWVVDETNAGTQSPSGLPDYHQYQPKPPTSPSILPAYSDAGKHRVQLNMHQEQLIEKYAKPGLKVVKTPWEAALETGSASAAFVEEHKLWPYSTQPTSTISPGPIPQYGYNRGASPSAGDVTDSGPSNYAPQNGQKLPQTQMQPPKQSNFNSQRDLAYKPNIPQGWKAPSVALPKELYVPKEIPLESYAAPPVASSSLYSIPATSPISWSPAQASAFTPAHIVEGPGPKPQSYSSVVSAQVPAQSSFPLSKPLGDGGFGFCSNSHYTPPKQPHLPPNSYQTLQQGITPAPAVNFSPSPLPYDKLAKFENYSESMSPPIQSSSPHYRPLAVPGAGSKVRNLSPVPYGVRPTLAASQSLPPQPVSGYGRPGSSRPPSQQYGAPYAVGGHENSSLSPRAHVAADLSHCQNFNNAARGWGAGGNRASFGGSCRNVKPLPVTANLPYTDF